MHKDIKGVIITMVTILIEGIISIIIEGITTMVGIITPGHTLHLQAVGKVFNMEVLKDSFLEMGANKEILRVEIPITRMLYLMNVKSVLEEGIQHQIATLELITVNHLVGSWLVKSVGK